VKLAGAILVGIIVVVIVASGFFLAGSGNSITGLFASSAGAQQTGGQEKIVLADIPGLPHGVVYVALKKGFFEKRGLDVKVEKFTFGSRAFEALFAGKVDVAMVGDFPAALAAFKSKDFVITGTLSENYYVMVARQDRGITSFADLRGKNIAVKTGTGPQFLFNKVLEREGLDSEDVFARDVDPTLMPLALVRGDVDAIFAWPPFDLKASQTLGANAIVLPLSDVHKVMILLVFRKEFVEKNPQAVRKFMSALVDAEEFIKQNPAESRKAISEITGLTDEDLQRLWSRQKFEVFLKEGLTDDLREQGAFAVSKGLAKSTGSLPDFCSLVYANALKEAAPEKVSLKC